MGRIVKNLRHLLELAATLRRQAAETHQQDYIEKLLRAATELEGRAHLLAEQRPGELADLEKDERLHAPVDLII